MSTNFCYFLLAFQVAVAFGAVENSFVRIQHGEPGTRKIVSLMNSDQIVNFLLESSGAIVDCHVYRRKEILLKIFLFEVRGLYYKTFGTRNEGLIKVSYD